MTVFTLQPFGSTHPDIAITGTLKRTGHQLAIAYQLSGNLNQILIPTPATPPTRKYDLWETTCLEFFLGSPNHPHYWEVNLSPAGDWNVFHLEAYRYNLQEVLAIKTLAINVESAPSVVTLSLHFDLTPLGVPQQPLDLGICAVIQSVQSSLSYWALAHCGPQADFHQRDSFILSI